MNYKINMSGLCVMIRIDLCCPCVPKFGRGFRSYMNNDNRITDHDFHTDERIPFSCYETCDIIRLRYKVQHVAVSNFGKVPFPTEVSSIIAEYLYGGSLQLKQIKSNSGVRQLVNTQLVYDILINVNYPNSVLTLLKNEKCLSVMKNSIGIPMFFINLSALSMFKSSFHQKAFPLVAGQLSINREVSLNNDEYRVCDVGTGFTHYVRYKFFFTVSKEEDTLQGEKNPFTVTEIKSQEMINKLTSYDYNTTMANTGAYLNYIRPLEHLSNAGFGGMLTPTGSDTKLALIAHYLIEKYCYKIESSHHVGTELLTCDYDLKTMKEVKDAEKRGDLTNMLIAMKQYTIAQSSKLSRGSD